MTVDVTVFHLPDGRQTQETTDLTDALRPQYDLVLSVGLRFTAEILTTGKVSVTLEEADLGDYDIRISVNGPAVQAGMAEMLSDFDPHAFAVWKEDMSLPAESPEGDAP
jgi:hypothetical protein